MINFNASEMTREMLSFMPIFFGVVAVLSAIGWVVSIVLILQEGGEKKKRPRDQRLSEENKTLNEKERT